MDWIVFANSSRIVRENGNVIMARKLKTFVTNLGFFELALAAPSMKAALEAWGMGHNAFHHGFARETDDPKIIAAAMAKPGVVLRRPVGTTGAFSEHAELPRNWKIAPPKTAAVKPVSKPPSRPAPKPAKKPRDDKKERATRADIFSFETAKARRAREREKAATTEAEREAAHEEKDRAQRMRDAEKAEAALARAQARHDEVLASIEKDRAKLDRRAEIENDRWKRERDELKAGPRGAKA
jgi:hypothetical protein